MYEPGFPVVFTAGQDETVVPTVCLRTVGNVIPVLDEGVPAHVVVVEHGQDDVAVCVASVRILAPCSEFLLSEHGSEWVGVIWDAHT